MIDHDGRIELHNVEQLQEVPGKPGRRLQRLTDDVRRQLEAAADVALCPTNCEVRFVCDLRAEPPRVTLYSDIHHEFVRVFRGDFLVSETTIEPGETQTIEPTVRKDFSALVAAASTPRAFHPNVWRFQLSGTGRVHLIAVEGAGVRPPAADEKPPVRWLAYGSSITQGFSSPRLASPYVQQAARLLRWDVINLGFGGTCRVEPAMADHFAGRGDYDVITLELGVNVLAEMNSDEFDRRVRHMLDRVTAARPDAAVVAISIFPLVHDYAADPPRGRQPDVMRKIVRDAAAAIRRPNLTFVDGVELLPTLEGLTADLVHPADAGHATIANRLAPILAAKESLRRS